MTRLSLAAWHAALMLPTSMSLKRVRHVQTSQGSLKAALGKFKLKPDSRQGKQQTERAEAGGPSAEPTAQRGQPAPLLKTLSDAARLPALDGAQAQQHTCELMHSRGLTIPAPSYHSHLAAPAGAWAHLTAQHRQAGKAAVWAQPVRPKPCSGSSRDCAPEQP